MINYFKLSSNRNILKFPSIRLFSFPSILINGPPNGKKISISILNSEEEKYKKNRNVQVLYEAIWSNNSIISIEGIKKEFFTIEKENEQRDGNEENLFLEIDTKEGEENIFVHVKVPEIMDLELEADSLDVETKNKIMGDLTIIGESGRVVIDKIKGSNLFIDIGKASLQINRVLEGNSIIRAGSVKGKMVNGDNVSIFSSSSVKLDAIYGAKSSIIAHDNILMNNFRGNLNVRSYHGDLQIYGVDGDIKAVSDEGNCEVHLNNLKLDSTESIVLASQGSITCHISPELRAAITMESKEIKYENLECEGNENEIVHNKRDSSGIITVLHTFSGLSDTCKSPNWNKKKQTGKINLSAAEESFRLQLQDNASKNLNEKPQPLFALNAKNSISFGTLTWKDSIRQRFYRRLEDK